MNKYKIHGVWTGLLCLICLTPPNAQAQMLPVPKGVGVSLRAATYGVEVHVPISVAPRWDIGIQGVLYWSDAYYNTLPELHSAGLKARYFFLPENPKHYISGLIGANGFEDQSSGNPIDYTPVVGAAYGLEYMLPGRTLGAGVELQGGTNFTGEGYVGVGISLVFYRN